jgi:hypothetical protein
MIGRQDPDLARHNGRSTLLALGVALLMLTAIEVGFRAVASDVSGNLAHIRDFGRLFEEFARAPRTRVVFMGNSLTNNAISSDVFPATAAALAGETYATLKLVPDGTSLWDWRCIANQLPPARDGDRLIIGYAWDQITDQQVLRVDRTFGLVCPLDELPATATFYPLHVGQWIEAGVSRLSLLYVLRERVGSAILSSLVPDFQSEMQRINDEARESAGQHAAVAKPRTYAALIDMLHRVGARGYRVTIVAMPTVDGYSTDPDLPLVLDDLGAQFLDFRSLPQIDDTHFIDSIHLGPAGAKIFTEALAGRVLASAAPPRGP